MDKKSSTKELFNQSEQMNLKTRFLSFRELLSLSLKLYNHKFWLGFILPLVLGLPVFLLLTLLVLIFVSKLEVLDLNLIFDGVLVIVIWLLSFVCLLIYTLQWAYLNGQYDEINFSKFFLSILQKTLSLINYYVLWLAFIIFISSIVMISGIFNLGSVGPVVIMIVLPFLGFFLSLLVFYTQGYILSFKNNLLTNLIQSILDTKSLYSVNLFRFLKILSVVVIIALIIRFMGANYLSEFLYSALDIAFTLAILTMLTALYFVSFKNVYSLSRSAGKTILKPIPTWQNNLVVGLGYGLIILWFVISALTW